MIAPLYEYLETPGLRFYSGAGQFIEQVEAALAEDPALAEQRQAVVHRDTWDVRASQLAALIHSLLRGQRYSHGSSECRPLMEGS